MPEQAAADAHQRQHAGDARCRISRREVDALVAEHALDDRLPSMEVKMRPAIGGPDERVPLVRRPRKRVDDDAQSARFETLAFNGRIAGVGSFRHRAAVVKRNSASSCSMRGRVRASPP